MSTAISALGGVGLFLLGMTVMTQGLKALAGSGLRAVLSKAAATPLRGSFWGALVTLLVQSSSATTMTTIGLVSAGLLTFPQGLGLVFGANVGTTGTGWLVALIGVRVSLTAAAMPMIFTGALIKLLASGRVSGAGAALAGFGLVLFGLTTLQQGMGGLAEQLHPADFPAVLAGPDAPWWRGMLGALALVLVGTGDDRDHAIVDSSRRRDAIGLLRSAIGLDQGCALIIGQNIGTATSSALAAIGASTTAKRLAVAYVLFKLIAAVIALLLFPIVIPALIRASKTVDGVTLLAAYHTAYNVVGVVVLLPLVDRFTQLVERILPERGSPLTRGLDPSALATPIVAVEAVRRTIARALAEVCGSIEAALVSQIRDEPVREQHVISVREAGDALRQAQIFLSDVAGPPETEDEQRRLTSTLHALDHASRLAEAAAGTDLKTVPAGPDDLRADGLCAHAMGLAISISDDVGAPAGSDHPAKKMTSTQELLLQLEHFAAELERLQRTHRKATLSAVANGTLTADVAIARVDTLRSLQAFTRHAWRATVHLANGEELTRGPGD